MDLQLQSSYTYMLRQSHNPSYILISIIIWRLNGEPNAFSNDSKSKVHYINFNILIPNGSSCK